MTGPINNESQGFNFTQKENNLDRSPPPFNMKDEKKPDSAANANTSSDKSSLPSPATFDEKITSVEQLMQNKTYKSALEQGIIREVNDDSNNASKNMKKNMNSRGNQG